MENGQKVQTSVIKSTRDVMYNMVVANVSIGYTKAVVKRINPDRYSSLEEFFPFLLFFSFHRVCMRKWMLAEPVIIILQYV